MSGVKWTIENLAELGKLFLGKLKKNLRNDEHATVKLGETGQGIQPNYQVTFSNGVINPYRGSTHKRFEPAKMFDSQKLSAAFSLLEIEAAIALAVNLGKM
jgi:hypothetical protein